ncbi:hypothetical protein P43SY_010797 [Pythium insidiosum]|uniref:Uncharacterized protein n=1 Tax=Pythium insidiosum TaxID=114742 RepID=A0AAD5L5D8_PYTIN|nr:hypothetical protein P43SY_010797 [Pythium insidiosum]
MGKMLVVAVGENSQAGIIKKLISGGGAKKKAEEKNHEIEKDAYIEIQTPKLDEKEANNDYDDDDEESQSPLEGKLYRLTVLIGKLGTAVALLVFVIMCIRFSIDTFGKKDKAWSNSYISDYLEFFIVAITVLVVAIPEEDAS